MPLEDTDMAKKAKNTKTLVTFLLDRTGSMQTIKTDTMGAFNAYIDTLKASGAPIEFSLVQFDSVSIDKTCLNVPIADAPALTDANYEPRAWTPLIDAAYKTITAIADALTKRDDKPKVVVCIQTDGQENASREHTWDELNALIKEKTALGWQFNFMGASIDAYQQGAQMGISALNTMSYDSRDKHATRAAFAASASNLASFSTGARADMSYTMPQRASSKDAHIPKGLGSTMSSPIAKPLAKTKIVDDFKL